MDLWSTQVFLENLNNGVFDASVVQACLVGESIFCCVGLLTPSQGSTSLRDVFQRGLGHFNEDIGEPFLQDLGEGLIGSYFENAAVETSIERVTGYADTVIYRTGITGYNYNSTGTLEIITGREKFTGSVSLTSSESKEEGERYYKYYTLNNGNVKTFYKEELGKLHSNSGYIYYPTGEGAYDTLGLNDISESIETYAEVTGITQDKITIDLYGKTPLIGVLSEVSGVIQTALTESVPFVEPASSGANLTENSDDFKKNYIYYMGSKS